MLHTKSCSTVEIVSVNAYEPISTALRSLNNKFGLIFHFAYNIIQYNKLVVH